MFSRRVFFLIAAVLAAGSLVMAPGCDWLQGSGSESRQSPFLNTLRVSPSSVFCGESFSVSFRYDDPQGDIANVRITLQHSSGTGVREETPLWPENQSRSSGTVKFEGLSLACGSSGGVWSITVRLEDDRGHTSNTLSGQITLTSAG